MAQVLGTSTDWVGDDILDCARKMPKSVVLRQLWMFSRSYDVGDAIEELEKLDAVLRCEMMLESLEYLSALLDYEPILREYVEREHSAVTGNATWAEIERGRRAIVDQIAFHFDDLRDLFDPEYRLLEALWE